MVRLPVSGIEVALRAPDGTDDLLLQESWGHPVEVGIALLVRLADAGKGTRANGHDWSDLSVTDFEFLLLSLRASRFGQHLALGFGCPECGARVEVGFRVADYLAAVRPRAVAGVTPDPARHGWFRLDGAGFRLPTAGDQAAVAPLASPTRHLAERCLVAAARRAPQRGRVLRAMATMAPEVSRPIAGICPDCAAAVQAPLHVTRVVVGELRRAAGAVHDDVDLIARTYHWPEAAILALPQDRRRAYAERIRRTSSQAA
jgi:hypothetical protein